MPTPALIILARSPELGQVKTRLAQELSDTGALAVYRQLLNIVSHIANIWEGPVGLLATGSDSTWKNTGLESLPRRQQEGAGLGPRIHQALVWGLELSPQAIAIGTDCPALSKTGLLALTQGLQNSPVAFGPAEDGGYWSVAVNASAPLHIICASDLPWSQPQLLETTIKNLSQEGISVAYGPTLSDCDTLDDYHQACQCGYLNSIVTTHPSSNPLQ